MRPSRPRSILGDDPRPRITLTVDAEARRLTVEDNGIGMGGDEMAEALGTIARSGTKAFVERIEAAKAAEGATLIGQFGVGFYSTFMVAERVDVISRRAGAGSQDAWVWSSDGTFSVLAGRHPAMRRRAGPGSFCISWRMPNPYAERFKLERIVKAQSGHVPVPITIIEKPGAEPVEVADGAAALWTKPRARSRPANTRISTAASPSTNRR